VEGGGGSVVGGIFSVMLSKEASRDKSNDPKTSNAQQAKTTRTGTQVMQDFGFEGRKLEWMLALVYSGSNVEWYGYCGDSVD
jgi:hypothetical protein